MALCNVSLKALNCTCLSSKATDMTLGSNSKTRTTCALNKVHEKWQNMNANHSMHAPSNNWQFKGHFHTECIHTVASYWHLRNFIAHDQQQTTECLHAHAKFNILALVNQL